jgi:hypothetical protein
LGQHDLGIAPEFGTDFGQLAGDSFGGPEGLKLVFEPNAEPIVDVVSAAKAVEKTLHFVALRFAQWELHCRKCSERLKVQARRRKKEYSKHLVS